MNGKMNGSRSLCTLHYQITVLINSGTSQTFHCAPRTQSVHFTSKMASQCLLPWSTPDPAKQTWYANRVQKPSTKIHAVSSLQTRATQRTASRGSTTRPLCCSRLRSQRVETGRFQSQRIGKRIKKVFFSGSTQILPKKSMINWWAPRKNYSNKQGWKRAACRTGY